MKILFFDIENIHLPKHIFNSGKRSKFSPKPAGFCADLAYILVFGYKWLGDKEAQYIIPTKKQFKENHFTDRYILDQVFDIMNQADVVLTWYGSGHDFPFVTSRLAQAGMYIDQKTKHVDLIKTAKKTLSLSSNRLNNVASFFNKESKIDISPEIWAKTWSGDYDALVEMAKYCAQDVEVLEQVYESLKPLDSSMPHLGVDKGLHKHSSCPTCASTRMQSRGRRVTRLFTYQRLQCQECGSWTSGERIEK